MTEKTKQLFLPISLLGIVLLAILTWAIRNSSESSHGPEGTDRSGDPPSPVKTEIASESEKARSLPARPSTGPRANESRPAARPRSSIHQKAKLSALSEVEELLKTAGPLAALQHIGDTINKQEAGLEAELKRAYLARLIPYVVQADKDLAPQAIALTKQLLAGSPGQWVTFQLLAGLVGASSTGMASSGKRYAFVLGHDADHLKGDPFHSSLLDAAKAHSDFETYFRQLLASDDSSALRHVTARAAGRLELAGLEVELRDILRTDPNSSVRAEAFGAIASMSSSKPVSILAEAVTAEGRDPSLNADLIRLLPDVSTFDSETSEFLIRAAALPDSKIYQQIGQDDPLKPALADAVFDFLTNDPSDAGVRDVLGRLLVEGARSESMVQTYVTRALDGDLADDITSLLRNVHGSLTDAGQRAYFESAIATLGNHETYTAVRQQMTDASKVLQELEARDTFGLPPDQVDKLVSEANAVQERINTLSLQLDDLRTIK